MKTALGVCMVALIAGAATADVYNDNVGNHLAGGDLHDFFQSQGFDHLDLVSVTITNDATNLYIDVTANASLDATNWGKYVVGFDTGANAGDNSTDPGSWNRNVDWGRGITHFIGTWADDGGSGFGGELRHFDGAVWNLVDATWLGGGLITGSDAGHALGTQSIVVNMAAMGLSIGDTFEFDVFSTGGGADPGVDHLSRNDPSTVDWATTSVAGQFLSYTIVPSPSSIALLGLGGLAVTRRRR